MFTNWNRKAKEETRLNPLSIDDIDALTIATLRGMGTTPEKFRENVKQDMPEDAMEQGEAIMRRNPKVQMPDSHFKLQGAQEQQMMDDIELEIPEFHFDEGTEEAKLGVKQMARDSTTQRALNAYKDTYKDHVMQAFDKHKAFMQSLGNQPMTVQEFMQHPKVPSFADYYKQAQEGTAPGSEYADEHPFALTHPDEINQHINMINEQSEINGYPVHGPFIPVITGEPMDLAMDTLLKFQSAAQRRIYSEIPTLQEFGLQAKDVPVIRNIPVHRLESGGMPAFNMPVPLRGERPGDPLEFERQIAREGGATIPGFTLDYEIPDDPRKEIQGTFVWPNDLQSITPELRMGYPDFNWGIGDTVTLGILDKPEWMAGMAHGRTQPEGYQPFGFDKDAFVRLDGGLGTAAIAPRRELVSSARRILTGNPLTGDAYKYYDYKPVYDMLSRLPATTLESQRDPVTGYLPKTSDFLLDRMGGARIVASEPMDLAIDALLKGEQHNEWFKEYYENNPIIPFFSIKDHRYLNEAQNRDDYFDRMNKLSEFHKDENKTEPSTDIQFPAGFQFSNKSEPMDLVMNALLKDLSPEAKRHKLEYDKKYESSPERVKYREELNRERRRRGIYGSGDHMDVSHTEGGKLTLESEHDNRARHFKDKGTLRPSE